MKVTLFSANPSGFTHEEKQLKEIASVLHDDQSSSPVYMLTNVSIGNNEIDCILLTEKGPFLIDCKAYLGKVFGCENSDWWVEFRGKRIEIHKNLFQQARKQRFTFLDKWEAITKKHFPKLVPKDQRAYFRVWEYFKPGSTYEDDRFDIKGSPWFGIVTRDTLIAEMRRQNVQYRLNEESFDTILKEFGISMQDAKEVIIQLISDVIPDEQPDSETGGRTEGDDIITPTTPTLPIPLIIQKGPIKITLPPQMKNQSPEYQNVVNEAIALYEKGKLEHALNLANHALTIDKDDREVQDLKYDILYQLKRGEEAETFITGLMNQE